MELLRTHEQNLNYASIPPVLALYQLEEDTYVYVTKEFNVIRTDGSGHLLEALRPVKKDVANRRNLFRIDEKQLVVDYSVKGTREDNGNKDVLYENQKIEPVKRVWNRTYYLGTDTLGRDLLIRVLYGARISLMVSILSAFLNLIVGVLYGSIAGYLGGRVDNVMMRFLRISSSIPMTLYVILLMVALGQGIHSIVLAMGLVLWVRMARIVRGQVLHIRNRDYVDGGQGAGGTAAGNDLAAFHPEYAGAGAGGPVHADSQRDLSGGFPKLHRSGNHSAQSVLGNPVQRRAGKPVRTSLPDAGAGADPVGDDPGLSQRQQGPEGRIYSSGGIRWKNIWRKSAI